MLRLVYGRCLASKFWYALTISSSVRVLSLMCTPVIVFAFPQADAYGEIHPLNPDAGNVTFPLANCRKGPYSTSSMTLYSNLTTSVTPSIMVMLVNRTFYDTTRDSQWSQ